MHDAPQTKLDNGENMNANVKAIKQAFGDNGPMYFSVSFFKHGTEGNTLFDVIPAIKAIGSYNEFSPAKLCKAFASCIQYVHSIRVGREYSPVVYIKASDPNDLLTIMDALRQIAKPNELSSKDGEIRAWWD